MVWCNLRIPTRNAIAGGFLVSVFTSLVMLYYTPIDTNNNFKPICDGATTRQWKGNMARTIVVNTDKYAGNRRINQNGNGNSLVGDDHTTGYGNAITVSSADRIQGHLMGRNTAKPSMSFEPLYREIKCITARSAEPCSFPLLTDYHRRCGYFAGSTSWRDIEEGYPAAKLSAQICKVPPVRSASTSLHDFIIQRNITSVTLTGDSQGFRYNKALIQLFEEAEFQCKMLKQEAAGKKINLDYYTHGTGFKPGIVVSRTCRTCQSNLHLCTNTKGFNVSVEYIAMPMQDGSIQPIRLPLSVCKNKAQHPLCQNLTQQEYVFKHYLRRNGQYPQLLLIFSAFPFATFVPLQQVYDGMRYLLERVTQNAPETSNVIWYSSPPWHVKNSYYAMPAEGEGLSLNDKMQLLNRFLSLVLSNYHKTNSKPAVYPFFDLYHMQEQLKEEWAEDEVHSKQDWYQYVMAYTATMLPSLPIA